MSFDALIDRARHGTGIEGPAVLYHYTSAEAAESILRAGRFRATAHDCTNDRTELVYADDAILEVVAEALASAKGAWRTALSQFAEQYRDRCIGSTRRTYLTCFSRVRDDSYQWRKYGSDGAGICLGLAILKAPAPHVEKLATAIMPVEYGLHQLRSKLRAALVEFGQLAEGVAENRGTIELIVQSLINQAMAWALSTKSLEWEAEREDRMIFLVRAARSLTPERLRLSEGKERRYITVPLTASRRLPLIEVILGPRFAGDDAALRDLVRRLGYAEAQVVRSNAQLSLEQP